MEEGKEGDGGGGGGSLREEKVSSSHDDSRGSRDTLEHSSTMSCTS